VLHIKTPRSALLLFPPFWHRDCGEQNENKKSAKCSALAGYIENATGNTIYNNVKWLATPRTIRKSRFLRPRKA
jgi:hypothetical protein